MQTHTVHTHGHTHTHKVSMHCAYDTESDMVSNNRQKYVTYRICNHTHKQKTNKYMDTQWHKYANELIYLLKHTG